MVWYSLNMERNEKQWTCYVLETKTGHFYVGMSSNFEKRLKQHVRQSKRADSWIHHHGKFLRVVEKTKLEKGINKLNARQFEFDKIAELRKQYPEKLVGGDGARYRCAEDMRKLYGNRAPFGTTLLPTTLDRMLRFCATSGIKIWAFVDQAVREKLDKAERQVEQG